MIIYIGILIVVIALSVVTSLALGETNAREILGAAIVFASIYTMGYLLATCTI